MSREKFVIFSLFFLFAKNITAQEMVQIWQDQKVRHGDEATLMPFIADDSDGTAIIICPGGSYFWLDDGNEGEEVAEWLQEQGISAFVLRYRVAGFGAFFWHHRRIFRGRQHPDMLKDAQQALKYVKEHSTDYHIDPNRLGLLGFSAGGHLALMTACFSDKEENRPAFVGAIYPVVTMNAPYAHDRSRRALLSECKQNNQIMRDSLSIERHIPDNCPPVFLINCRNDDVVDYHNSILLDSALTAKNIDHRYIQYKIGKHGFGVSEVFGSKESRQWKYEFVNWLKELKF